MYKVSVVTPFHNVDMGMFEKCAEGMRRQTIGFENIEWIIVVHNSEPRYMPLLTEMFKDDKNVIIKELNDGLRSPAPPRNHGVLSVTAPCMGFLDADDSYTPPCLEVARREMMETRSQVVTFRREYELEHESLHPHTEVVAWDQIEWRIVMERKDYDMDKMFSGLWAFTTSRLFDTAFIRKHNITYSKDILWVEDVAYSARCLMLADRVCYLPQFIGYHYFINSGSIIQDKRKSVREITECFSSAGHIIDDLQALGVDTTSTTNTLLTLLTQYYLASDLTVEQRRTLCDMIQPYLRQQRKMTPSKLQTPEECYLSYHLPQEVLRNAENPQDCPVLKEAINGWKDMMDILRNNASADYGRHYHFERIETLADYQRMVPMTDYENYKPLLELQTNIGESGILTTAPTRQYLVNAKGQRIPCTDQHLTPYMESFATTLKGHHNLLVAIVGKRNRQTNDGCTVETLESQMVKKYMWYYHYARGKRKALFSMPDDLFFKTDPKEEMHTICRYALLDRDIDQIVALDTRRVADMFDYITLHRDTLTAELRDADEERAGEVEAAFSSDKPLATVLWPRLERVIAFGAGEYYEATARMRQFTGQTPHNNGYYYTEETVYGHAVADDSNVFETIPSGAFHEYLPLEKDHADTVLSTDTRPDTPYQLVVTNNAGLYRYVTDHIVVIKETQIDKILFTIY